MKNTWIDPEIPMELKEILIKNGSKKNIEKGVELVSEKNKSPFFILVEKGLLSVNINFGIFQSSMIIKFIPENRGYGFTNYITPSLNSHSVYALKDSVITTIPYSVINNLLKENSINKQCFITYLYQCKKTSNKCLTSIYSYPVNKRLLNQYSLFIESPLETYNSYEEFTLLKEYANFTLNN